MLNNEQNIINDYKNGIANNSNCLPHDSDSNGNICNATHDCHRPLRLWSIKYTVIGFSKFTGVAIVQAATLKEAECIFKQNSKFNGFIDRIKINCIEEVLPNPEPLLLQEDTVAILDKSVLKSYPFLLKSEYCDKLNELEGKFIKYTNDLKEEINLEESNEFNKKITDINKSVTTIQGDITSIGENKQDKISVTGDNVHLVNNVLSVDKQQASDFDIKDLTDSTNLRTGWNDKQDRLTAGENITINNNVISAVDTKYKASDFDIKDLADSTNLKNIWNNKQDKLTAGNRIKIEDNIISAIGTDINDDVITNQTTWSSKKISDEINDGNIMFTRNNVPIPLSAPDNTEKSTFSANQTENVVCDIQVPEKTSDLTNDAKFGSLADVLVDGKVIIWNNTTQKLETATTEQLTELLLWAGTETELRELKENDGLEEGKLYATYDNVEFE